MARLNSFFLPSPAWPSSVGESTLLDGPEARHMLKVLRTRTDDVVRLFDGCGREGLFRVAETSRNKAVLEAVKLDFHQPPAASVTVACGWNKSSRRGFLFEKAVELRAGGVAFWQSARSQGGMPDCPKDVWTEKCVQAASSNAATRVCPSCIRLPGACRDCWNSESASTGNLLPGKERNGNFPFRQHILRMDRLWLSSDRRAVSMMTRPKP